MQEGLPEIIAQKELKYIQRNLMQQVEKKKNKRFFYESINKQNIAKYTFQFGPTKIIRKFKHRFPNLNENTARHWLTKCKKNLKEKKKTKNHNITLNFGQTLGKPLLLNAKLE